MHFTKPPTSMFCLSLRSLTPSLCRYHWNESGTLKFTVDLVCKWSCLITCHITLRQLPSSNEIIYIQIRMLWLELWNAAKRYRLLLYANDDCITLKCYEFVCMQIWRWIQFDCIPLWWLAWKHWRRHPETVHKRY